MRPLFLDSFYNPEGMAQFMSFIVPNQPPSLTSYFLGTDDQSRAIDPPGGFPRIPHVDFNGLIIKVDGGSIIPESSPGPIVAGTLILAAGATQLRKLRRPAK